MQIKAVVIASVSFTIFYFASYFIFRGHLETLHPLPLCREGENCVRFCCMQGQGCSSDADFNLTNIKMARNLAKDFKVLKGKACTSYLAADYSEATSERDDSEFTLLPNGSATEVDGNKTDLYTTNDYCLHHMEDELIPLVCTPINNIEEAKQLYPWLMIASVPFLIITFAVYVVIPQLRSIHDKCVMSYVLSLIVMYSSLSAVNTENAYFLEHRNKTCKLLGYLTLSSVLVCFFWLNVMCYDTWSTLRKLKVRSPSKKTFIGYCIYAFGMPITSIFTVFILNELEIIPMKWRTGIGYLSCTVSDPVVEWANQNRTIFEDHRRAQFLYLFGPILLLLVLNFVLYGTTTFTIWKTQQVFKNIAMVRHAKKEAVRFGLYVRFFIMMGLPWVIEFVSWFIGDSEVLFVASIINCLQGFIIFVIFVARSRILELAKKSFNKTNLEKNYGFVKRGTRTMVPSTKETKTRDDKSDVFSESQL